MTDNDRFIPPRYLRGSYTQTVLASARIRAMGRNPMRDASREMIIDAGDGVRLQGFFSHPVPDSGRRAGDPPARMGRQRGIHLYPPLGRFFSNRGSPCSDSTIETTETPTT
jgi:hypothetical protein